VDYRRDKQPGNRMPCPLCRKKFTIPADGLSGTQKNYDMEKLLSARKLSAGEDAGQREGGLVLCDVCSSEAAPPATKRCLECQQNYCDQCSQNQIKSDREKITELLKKTGGVLPRIEKEKNDLVKRLGDVEGEINTAADKLIAADERVSWTCTAVGLWGASVARLIILVSGARSRSWN